MDLVRPGNKTASVREEPLARRSAAIGARKPPSEREIRQVAARRPYSARFAPADRWRAGAAGQSAVLATSVLLLATAACSREVGTRAILDPNKVSAIVVGQTPKAEVLGDLGPPGRVDRNGQGESWIYRVEDRDTRGRQIETGAQVISAAVGAFVPFGGLVGTGVGLASKGVAGSEKEPAITTLTVDFGAQGIVRECTITTNFVPADAASGPNAASLPPVDCRRPLAAAPR